MNAVPSPTDGLAALAAAARGARVAASALRWLAAAAVAFAVLLALSVALALVDRSGEVLPPQGSASASLDFDLGVLRILSARSLRASEPDDALRSLWAHRPPWTFASRAPGATRLVPLADAWAAALADRSRFRHAARGALDALGLLLAGLSLSLAAAALAGALSEWVRARAPRAWARRAIIAGAALVLVALPLWSMLDPAVFYDRARSVGTGAQAAVFVAAFAGSLSGAAMRALFGGPRQARHLTALGGRPALLSAARLSALDASQWLLPLLPALAAAAVFACAKADQDAAQQGATSGLGALIRAAMQEASVGERLSSAALVGGALVALWSLGHRMVCEVRSSLGGAA